MFLSDLEDGEMCLIRKINLSNDFAKRLKDFGINHKSKITIIRKSKNNCPIIFLVKNTFLALRIDDAKKIIVEKINDE